MTSSNIKQRQIIHLSNQLTILLNRSSILEDNLITTSEQASYINLLGAYHTAWLVCLTPSFFLFYLT
jgi:hypothetical protein